MFNFASPPPAGAVAAPNATPGFGGPPQAAGPIDVSQALAGFADAPIDTREPWLPMGFAGTVKLLKTEGKNDRDAGLGLYIHCEIARVANPGGGEAGAQLAQGVKNPNLVPARVGGRHVMRINGFSSKDARAFAYSDLKTFLIAALESKGLRADSQLSADDWNKGANAAFQGALPIAGVEIGVQHGAVNTKGPHRKQKTSFYPLSAVTASGADGGGAA